CLRSGFLKTSSSSCGSLLALFCHDFSTYLWYDFTGWLPWVWLGTQTEPKLEITDEEVNANERLTVATLYDSQPWDAKWLLDRYHLSMKPLPEHWQHMTDEDEKMF